MRGLTCIRPGLNKQRQRSERPFRGMFCPMEWLLRMLLQALAGLRMRMVFARISLCPKFASSLVR